jgi:hypothetical protein
MEAFEGIAHSKGSANPTEYHRWKESLSFARSSLSVAVLSDDRLLKLAHASVCIEHFNTLARYLYQSAKAQPDSGLGTQAFFDAVDESRYSLQDWIEAIHLFDQWLKNQKLQSNFMVMLGYLRCSAESTLNDGLKLTLATILSEMLQTHGFEGAVTKPV